VWLVDQIEPALDPLNTKFQSIEAPVDPRQPFFDGRQPNLDIEHLIYDAIELLVEAAHIL
jgi:hypothetical protein